MATIGGVNSTKTGLVFVLDAANPTSYVSGSTTWQDLSGNNNSGSLVNGSTFNSSNGGSIVFDGSNDYVEISTVNASSQFTLNFWVKCIQTGSVGNTTFSGIINKFNGIANQRNRFLLESNFRRFYFQPIIGGVSYDINSNLFSSIQNQISMCSLTYNGSLVTFYLNANNVGSSSLSGILDSSTSKPTIGWGADSADYYFNGNIYTIQIYNRALSATEILQSYNAMRGRFGI
jgi:hypothetical protein